MDLNPQKGNILPGSTRKFEENLGKGFMFGRYQAKLLASYGPDNKQLEAAVYFWVLPFKYIGLGLLALVILVLLLRAYNKAIISRAKRR